MQLFVLLLQDLEQTRVVNPKPVRWATELAVHQAGSISFEKEVPGARPGKPPQHVNVIRQIPRSLRVRQLDDQLHEPTPLKVRHGPGPRSLEPVQIQRNPIKFLQTFHSRVTESAQTSGNSFFDRFFRSPDHARS